MGVRANRMQQRKMRGAWTLSRGGERKSWLMEELERLRDRASSGGGVVRPRRGGGSLSQT
jgi:hypothetical protein